MGVTYTTDPTPGRHTAGSASWNETFGMKFALPKAGVPAKEVNVAWHGTDGKGVAQAHFSNSQQAMNGLGLCMFTGLTGNLPWADLLDALTGWGFTEKDLLECGERIQDLRNAFNVREGVTPADFAPPPRMFGEGDGKLEAGPLRGIVVPIERLRGDYYAAMGWNAKTGKLSRARAEKLQVAELLDGWLD
jgi:aldehyde:ferredoxin oxidoreductase